MLVAGLLSLVVIADPRSLPQATLPAMGGYMTDCGAVNFRRVAMVLRKLAEVEPWILKDRRARHEKEHQREQERAVATGGKVLCFQFNQFAFATIGSYLCRYKNTGKLNGAPMQQGRDV
jgi:hypothetical protein